MGLFLKVAGMAMLFGAAWVMSTSRWALTAGATASAQDVYLDKCSVCHGQDGSGNTAKGRKLKVKGVRTPEVQKLSEAEVAEIIAKGKGKDMDGFAKELGDDMVKQLAVYYRSLGK